MKTIASKRISGVSHRGNEAWRASQGYASIRSRIQPHLHGDELGLLDELVGGEQWRSERETVYVPSSPVEAFAKAVAGKMTSSIESAVADSVQSYLKPETERLQQVVAHMESYEQTTTGEPPLLMHQLLERVLADLSKVEDEKDRLGRQLAELRAKHPVSTPHPWERTSADVEIRATNDAQILGEDGDDFLVVFYEEDMTPVEARVAKKHFVGHPGRPREGSSFVIVVYRDRDGVKASAWPIPSNWHPSLWKNATE